MDDASVGGVDVPVSVGGGSGIGAGGVGVGVGEGSVGVGDGVGGGAVVHAPNFQIGLDRCLAGQKRLMAAIVLLREPVRVFSYTGIVRSRRTCARCG